MYISPFTTLIRVGVQTSAGRASGEGGGARGARALLVAAVNS